MQPRIDAFPGWLVVPVTQPAAGAEWSVQNPGRGVWVVHSLVYRLATSAVAGNRGSEVQVTDGSSTFYRIASELSQAASLTFNYSAWDGAPMSTAAVVVVHLGWPTNGVIVPLGCTLRSLTANLDAGDQYSNIVALVEELPAGYGQRYLPSSPSTLDDRDY